MVHPKELDQVMEIVPIEHFSLLPSQEPNLLLLEYQT